VKDSVQHFSFKQPISGYLYGSRDMQAGRIPTKNRRGQRNEGDKYNTLALQSQKNLMSNNLVQASMAETPLQLNLKQNIGSHKIIVGSLNSSMPRTTNNSQNKIEDLKKIETLESFQRFRQYKIDINSGQ